MARQSLVSDRADRGRGGVLLLSGFISVGAASGPAVITRNRVVLVFIGRFGSLILFFRYLLSAVRATARQGGGSALRRRPQSAILR